MNKISEVYKLYADTCRPWKNDSIELVNEDITMLDDEVGSMVYLNSQGQETAQLEDVIESIKKEIVLAKTVADEEKMIITIKNLSLLLFVCELIKSDKNK